MCTLDLSNSSTLCAPFVRSGERRLLQSTAVSFLRLFITNVSVTECHYFADNAMLNTTFSNGSLGSRIDEERSEMR